jgi:two-component system, OmpR family, response regulator MtrA
MQGLARAMPMDGLDATTNGDQQVSILSANLSTLPPDLTSTSGVATRRAAILLIEDDPVLAEMLRERLGSNGHTVWHAASGAEAEAIEREIRPDLVIVDLVLPDANGLVLCANLRERWQIPIIICTASTRPEDAVLGFKLGADDFVRKPFSTDELEARIDAALRRPSLPASAAPSDDGVQVVGPLEIDRTRHTATVGDEEIHLTPIEFRLLSALADPPDHLHYTNDLTNQVWGEHDPGIARSMQVHLRRTRSKLKAAGRRSPTIVSVRGLGYRLIWEGTPTSPAPAVT